MVVANDSFGKSSHGAFVESTQAARGPSPTGPACDVDSRLQVVLSGVDAGVCGVCNYKGDTYFGYYWKYVELHVDGTYTLDFVNPQISRLLAIAPACYGECVYSSSASGVDSGTIEIHSGEACNDGSPTTYDFDSIYVSAEVDTTTNYVKVVECYVSRGAIPGHYAFRTEPMAFHANPGTTKVLGESIGNRLDPGGCVEEPEGTVTCANGGLGVISDSGTAVVTLV